jgi:integrase
MSVARGIDKAPIASAVDHAWREIVDRRALASQSEARLGRVVQQFQSFSGVGLGLAGLDAVQAQHARSFILARKSDGSPPSISTMHLRRSAVRLLFAMARQLGLATGDPTLDLPLAPRSSLHRRPLTDDEIAVGRSFAGQTLSETRRPAAWALAEATARTSELPHIRPSDLDLSLGRVWIHGASKTDARWGHLTEWGARQLEERLRSVTGDAPLVYAGDGSGESGQASCCAAIGNVLRRAGLAGEPDVGPSSVAAWPGARAFREGASIDEVAGMLGIRSLDRAARCIGWDWARQEQG